MVFSWFHTLCSGRPLAAWYLWRAERLATAAERWQRRGWRPTKLMAMRLADMTVTHPEMDVSRFCCQCNARLGIYPSGQKAIAAFPEIELICNRCGNLNDGAVPAPGALEEAGFRAGPPTPRR